MSELTFRKVEKKDLNVVFPLLQQLTEIDYSNRDIDESWRNFSKNTSVNGIVGIFNNEIVAYGCIVIENKIRGDVSGQIEDIVVDQKHRKLNIGYHLIKELVTIGRNKSCYRITLFCDEKLIPFYSKNGFEVNNIVMKKFFKNEL